MTALRPMMSARRQAAIDRALEGYSAPVHKLSFDLAEQIRDRYNEGETVSSLARSFRVARQSIHPILDYRNYPVRERFLWRELSGVVRGATAAGTGLTWAELYWLAGWLEGEGSFTRPPPSSPRGARLLASSCDEDVVREVARLLRVKPRMETRGQEKGWSPIWRVLLTGGRAVCLMQAIEPVMGRRRKKQIEKAIKAAGDAGAVLGWHENRSHRPHPDAILLSGG